MTTYEAQVNVPGYLPMSDEVHLFDTMAEAWEFLCAERERDLCDPMNDCAHEEDQCIDELQGLIESPECGTVYGSTPGYDGDHDLGLAYTVMEYLGD